MAAIDKIRNPLDNGPDALPLSTLRPADTSALPSADPVMGYVSPQEKYRQTMERFHSAADNISNAEVVAENPNDPGYLANLADIRAGTELAKLQYEHAHPWGTPESAHPGLWGKVGHVMGRIGDIAGTAVAPGVMGMIPGTALNRQLRENQDVSQLQEGRQAQIEQEKVEPKAASDEEQAFQSLIASGVKPIDAYRQIKQAGQKQAGDEAQATVTSGGQAFEWNPQTQKYDIPIGTGKSEGDKTPPHITAMKNGQAHIMERDPSTGEYSIDRGIAPPNFAQTGLWQPTEINVGGKLVPAKFNERTGTIERADVQGGGAAVPKNIQTEINKSMDTSRGADTRYRVMVDNEKPALEGNQQAMLNILANHIGMTMGLQKGARITQAVWDEAQQTAPYLQRIKAKFDKNGYLSGVTLSPEQIKQMVDLGYDRRGREWQQAQDTATQNGLDISGEIPRDVKKALQDLGPTQARGEVGEKGDSSREKKPWEKF